MNNALSSKRLPGAITSKGRSIDYSLLITIISLSLFGTIMVYSASAVVAVRLGNSPYFYFLRQLTWVGLGLIAGYILLRIDYRVLAKLALPFLITSIILLVIVLLVNYNQPIKRWINLGPFDLQPSELTKLSFFIYLSSWLSKFRDRQADKAKEALKKHFKYELLPFLVLTSFVCILILIEPDMDTTIMLAISSFIVYFISGSDFIHTFGSFLTATIFTLIIVVTTFMAKYRLSRITNFFEFWKTGSVQDPYNTGYQLRQILVAVATGGLFGLGFGQSRQKFHYLGDTAFSDTIFAIFAEEFGMIGCLILISLFIYIFFRGYKIAKNAPDRFGFLLAISITTWFTLQAFLHISANVALIPINGNTLPFFSYGGSSTVVNLAAAGILLNISKRQKRADSTWTESRSKPALVRRRRR